METVRFVVPGLGESRDRYDLGNVLTTLKGVEHVEIDTAAHSVSVLYDPDYSSEDTLRAAIRLSGYPVEDGKQ